MIIKTVPSPAIDDLAAVAGAGAAATSMTALRRWAMVPAPLTVQPLREASAWTEVGAIGDCPQKSPSVRISASKFPNLPTILPSCPYRCGPTLYLSPSPPLGARALQARRTANSRCAGAMSQGHEKPR